LATDSTAAHPLRRVPLLALGFIGLAFGVGAGLARLGVAVPSAMASAAALHGPLMIGAFLGTVIALERAVATGRRWAYAGPLLSGVGGIVAIAGGTEAGAWLLVAAGAVLVAASGAIFVRQYALFTFTLVTGALCWCLGSALWAAGAAVHDVVGWWLAFLILTIAGERLELSRFMPPSANAKRMFVAILLVIGAGLFGWASSWGAQVFAAGLVALALWLVRYDIARRTVRSTGLTRYIAVCLLSGYVWLAIGGAVVVAAGGFAPGTRAYDVAVHALGMGFVFSMVFGHAPVIFPAVLRVTMPYHAAFYVPLALLHLSLAVRIAGDAALRIDWVRVGALGNALAIAVFIATAASAVWRGRRQAGRPA
jgi:hypothetical protein